MDLTLAVVFFLCFVFAIKENLNLPYQSSFACSF